MQWWLLASNDVAKAVSRYQKRSNSFSDNWFLFAAVGGIALFWIALYYWDRHRKELKRVQAKKPRSVFGELCDAHKLSRGERGLLQAAAEQKQIPHPALLFVDRRILDGLVQAPGPQSAEYSRLAAKLFGAANPA